MQERVNWWHEYKKEKGRISPRKRCKRTKMMEKTSNVETAPARPCSLKKENIIMIPPAAQF